MTANTKPYRAHLTSYGDLITSDAGFRGRSASFALERKRRAAPFVHQARALRFALENAATPNDLAHDEWIQSALLVASGVPYNESIQLRPKEKAVAIQRFINDFLAPAGPNLVEELVNRFLLAHEDELNASTQTIGDILAQRKLSRALIATLSLDDTRYSWLHATSKTWLPISDDDSDIELHLRGLSWEKGRKRRTVVFNLTVPFLGNNVDLCLFSCGPNEYREKSHDPASYVALGELKGGIDPAGADEHWKTARAALRRIRDEFSRSSLTPHTFFIGAAVAKRMAQEIWDELENGPLENAANLSVEDQLMSVARWLCRL